MAMTVVQSAALARMKIEAKLHRDHPNFQRAMALHHEHFSCCLSHKLKAQATGNEHDRHLADLHSNAAQYFGRAIDHFSHGDNDNGNDFFKRGMEYHSLINQPLQAAARLHEVVLASLPSAAMVQLRIPMHQKLRDAQLQQKTIDADAPYKAKIRTAIMTAHDLAAQHHDLAAEAFQKSASHYAANEVPQAEEWYTIGDSHGITADKFNSAITKFRGLHRAGASLETGIFSWFRKPKPEMSHHSKANMHDRSGFRHGAAAERELGNGNMHKADYHMMAATLHHRLAELHHDAHRLENEGNHEALHHKRQEIEHHVKTHVKHWHEMHPKHKEDIINYYHPRNLVKSELGGGMKFNEIMNMSEEEIIELNKQAMAAQQSGDEDKVEGE